MSAQKQHTIFGIHSVLALLTKQPERITDLFIQKDRHDKKMSQILALARAEKHIAIHQVMRVELDQLSDNANHQGVLALTLEARHYSEDDLKNILKELQEPPFLLILDGVQDPHNLGACFRTADAAGVHALIAPKHHSVGLTPTVAKVASGATETVPFVQVVNLARTISMLKEQGIWIFGADMAAENNVYQSDLTGPIAIVLGGEGEGLRRLTRDSCDHLLKIPLYGSVDSLNVSVATGIVLFEALRQRKFKS